MDIIFPNIAFAPFFSFFPSRTLNGYILDTSCCFTFLMSTVLCFPILFASLIQFRYFLFSSTHSPILSSSLVTLKKKNNSPLINYRKSMLSNFPLFLNSFICIILEILSILFSFCITFVSISCLF